MVFIETTNVGTLVTRPCFLFSLLEEDSDEEEGDLCRICLMAGGSPTNPLLEPCGCVGSLKFVHQECLKKWLKVKITSGRWRRKRGSRAAACNESERPPCGPGSLVSGQQPTVREMSSAVMGG